MNKTNIICDIDGTIAGLACRVTYVRNLHDDPNWKVDWAELISAGQARLGRPCFERVHNHLRQLAGGIRRVELKQSGHSLYYLSGRTSTAREEVAKLGLTPENTLCVFDDNQAVVDMWRDLGFSVTCVTA